MDPSTFGLGRGQERVDRPRDEPAIRSFASEQEAVNEWTDEHAHTVIVVWDGGAVLTGRSQDPTKHGGPLAVDSFVELCPLGMTSRHVRHRGDHVSQTRGGDCVDEGSQLGDEIVPRRPGDRDVAQSGLFGDRIPQQVEAVRPVAVQRRSSAAAQLRNVGNGDVLPPLR